MVDAEITINDQTEGAATSNVDTKSMVGAGGKTVHRQVVTIGDNVTFGQTADVNANSELLVKHTDAIPVTDNAGSLTIDGTVGVSGSVAVTNANLDAGLSTLATQATLALIKAKTDNLDVALSTLETVTADVSDNALRDNGKIDIAAFDAALPTGTNNIGDVDILTIAAGDNNIGNVDIASIAAGDNNIGNVDIVSGTVTTVSTVTNLSQQGGVAISLNTGVRDTGTQRMTIATDDLVQVVGSIAHDTGDSGNPVKIGGVGRTTNPTAVTNADRVNATFDDLGRQVVVLSNVRDLVDTAVNASAITNTTETVIVAATASTFHDVVAIVISNSSAVATLVQIRDVAAGTVIMNIYSPAGSTVGVSLPHPIPQATVNTDWTAQAVTTASSLFVTMQYVSNV